MSDLSTAVSAAVIDLGLDVLKGQITDKESLAHKLVDLALDHIPVEGLKEYLDVEAKRRQELLYSIAVDAKFGTEEEP